MPERTEWIVLDELPMRFRVSEDYVVLEDHWIPRVFEVSMNGAANDGADPETYARVEVSDDGVPRLVELRMVASDPESHGIRQTDLRDFEVRTTVEDFIAGFTFRYDRDADAVAIPYVESSDYTSALRFVSRQRASRTSRAITPELLERVAKVYRANIDKYPTKAVQHHFQVSQRMAAEYVSRARRSGLLPPTKRGKKQA